MIMKCIIIDDELLSLKNTELIILNHFPNLSIINIFQSAQTALEFIKKTEIDLVFLDINMPNIDGFDFLELTPDRRFQVIFITAYEEFAIKAIKERVTDYLLKPIQLDELRDALERANAIHKTQKPNCIKSKIALSYSGGRSILLTHEIIYIQGIDNLCKIYLVNHKNISVSKTLKYFEKILDSRFFRIHKSYIVNLDFADKVIRNDHHYLQLKDSIELPISRRNYKQLLLKLEKQI